MVTRSRVPLNILAASKIGLANPTKAKLAEIDRTAISDADFRSKVLEYFKPNKPIQ